MKIAKQYLRDSNMTLVEPDTKCPECGRPWKKGASYGHKVCCGCPTCGFSTSLLTIDKSIFEGD